MNINRYLLYALPLALATVFGSCTDYLDKEQDTDVSSKDAFGNFSNFQGFIEEVHQMIPTKTVCYWNTTWNWGEDEILSTYGNQPYVTYNMDLGNFRAYYQNWGGNLTYLYGSDNPNDGERFRRHIVNKVWYCIRKCNLGLANFDQLTNATEEEKNTIKGELLFYRAWWHEEMMIFFGGLPYQTEVPDVNQKLEDPRMTLQETAVHCAEDFEAAAALLPANWDNAEVGSETYGHNDLRISKATALAYAGKAYLWAASPLAQNGAQLGASKNGNTYKYNEEYAKKAATLLGDCIALLESGETPYELASYAYDDIYNHTPAAGVTNSFSEIFWTQGKGWRQPGGKEAMMRGCPFDENSARWGEATAWGPNKTELCDGNYASTPTANYVNYAYGTADGYRLEDAPASSFDKTHPFRNRDTRFYHDIVFDGFEYINGENATFADYKYCSLYTGGVMRDEEKNSRTGYFCQKLFPHTCNKVDNAYDYGKSGASYLPYLRMADVYLMYAEAGAAVSGAGARFGATSKTAVDAINVLRDRVGVAHVLPMYSSSKETFMDEVRRERACELAFEGFRLNDLMRWLLVTEYPYTVKTSQEFTRDFVTDEFVAEWKADIEQRYTPAEDASENEKKALAEAKKKWEETATQAEKDKDYADWWCRTHDPKDMPVANWKEKTILTRSYDTKHYFFPFRDEDVYIYKGFAQNPGW